MFWLREMEFTNAVNFIFCSIKFASLILVVVVVKSSSSLLEFPWVRIAPYVSGPVLYSYEAEFIQRFLHEKKKSLTVALNSTFRYIDDVLPINNNQFHTSVDSIYPNELEIRDTTECSTSTSYLLKLDTNIKLTTQRYDKQDDFNFPHRQLSLLTQRNDKQDDFNFPHSLLI
jgi:hypothetical protein